MDSGDTVAESPPADPSAPTKTVAQQISVKNSWRLTRLRRSSLRIQNFLSNALTRMTYERIRTAYQPALTWIRGQPGDTLSTSTSSQGFSEIVGRVACYFNFTNSKFRRRVRDVHGIISGSTTRITWQEYVDLATFCPLLLLRLPPTRWIGVGNLGMAPDLLILGPEQTRTGLLRGPDLELETGYSVSKISVTAVAFHTGMILGFVYALVLATFHLFISVSDKIFVNVYAPYIRGLVNPLCSVYIDYATPILCVVLCLFAASPLLDSSNVPPLVSRSTRWLRWQYIQTTAVACLASLLFLRRTPEHDIWSRPAVSRSYVIDAWNAIHECVQPSVLWLCSFVRGNILTGLFFVATVQSCRLCYALDRFSGWLAQRLLEMSTDLTNVTKKLFDTQRASTLEISSLREKLAHYDSTISNMEAAKEVELARFQEEIQRLEDASHRLMAENGRLDISFEDRVQTEMEDRDRCIGGLRDKCERLRKELEEAERTLADNAKTKVNWENTLQEQIDQRSAERQKLEAEIISLSQKLGEAQATWTLEKEQWENEKNTMQKEWKAKETKERQALDDYRRAREKSSEEHKANASLLQRQIGELHDELWNLSEQRKDAECALVLLKQKLSDVEDDLCTSIIAKEALEQIIKQWECEAKEMDEIWQEIGIVSGKWEVARNRFNGLVAQAAGLSKSTAPATLTSPTDIPQPLVLPSLQYASGQKFEHKVDVYQIPAKRAPLYVAGSPKNMWPILEEQVPSWIPMDDTSSVQLGGHVRNSSYNFTPCHQKKASRGVSGTTANATRDNVPKPSLRTGAGLKANLGNNTTPNPTTTTAATISGRGLLESMHAPKRSLTPVVCETFAPGTVTPASEFVNLPGNLSCSSMDKSGVTGV